MIHTLVYDDAVTVPPGIVSLLGISRFGGLVHDRVRLADRVAAATRAAGVEVRLHVHDRAEALALAERLGDQGGRYLYLSADVVGAGAEALELVLAKLAFADRDTLAAPEGAPPGSGLAALSARALARRLTASNPAERRAADAELTRIPAPELRCLADADTLVSWLSGSFYTRAFNQVRARGRTLRKESADVAKMKKEHDFWYLLPPRLQRFFVQPFDFEQADGRASYRMERLHVPDMAVLWIHGPEAVPEEAFDALLDGVFEWVNERPTRPVPASEAEAVANALYVGKLDERLARFLGTPTGQQVDRWITEGTRHAGLRGLADAYRAVLPTLGRPGTDGRLAVTHGDLCFSNILFDRRSQVLKFIDPRGAVAEPELWSDPYYDLAKLSHSILGGYDFMNHGLFDLHVDEHLKLALRLDRSPNRAREERFAERLAAAGYDLARVRVFEASLFLSMLPLHAEAPRKTLAFALTAARILDELSAPPPRQGWLARWFG